MSAFLKLDVFRKLPKDLTEPTTCGAMGKSKVLHNNTLANCDNFSLNSVCNRLGIPHCNRDQNLHAATDLEHDRGLVITLQRHFQDQHRYRDA